jgi:hypothetical protein
MPRSTIFKSWMPAEVEILRHACRSAAHDRRGVTAAVTQAARQLGRSEPSVRSKIGTLHWHSAWCGWRLNEDHLAGRVDG